MTTRWRRASSPASRTNSSTTATSPHETTPERRSSITSSCSTTGNAFTNRSAIAHRRTGPRQNDLSTGILKSRGRFNYARKWTGSRWLGWAAAGEENRQADADDEPAREAEPHEEGAAGPEIFKEPCNGRPRIGGAHVSFAAQRLFTVRLLKRRLFPHTSFHIPRHRIPSLAR